MCIALAMLAGCGGGGAGGASKASTPSTTRGIGDCVEDTLADAGANHVTNPPVYEVSPPAGGPHYSRAAPPGVYSPDRVPEDGFLVHSVEHGYVVLWYQSPADLPTLKAVADRFSFDVLVVPRQDMATPVAATAWHHRLLCRQADEAALAAFIDRYRNKGPEAIPHDIPPVTT